MKIIFMGTPAPAAKILKALIESEHQIACVITQPDRPQGRGQKIVFSPVKELALQNDLPIEQPGKARNNPVLASLIKSLAPDIIVVAAYGQILPKEIIEIAKYGTINLHASLLPKYRGAAPVQWALLNGEKETGISIMRINERLDAGDIISQETIKIEQADDAETMLAKLFEQGKSLLLLTLKQIEQGKAHYLKQDDNQATLAPSITKESAEIDWKKPAPEIHNRVRAMVPWPVAHTFYQEKLLKIWKTEVVSGSGSAGEILDIIKGKGFVVAAGQDALLVLEVQLEAKKRMSAYDFTVGKKLKIHDKIPS